MVFCFKHFNSNKCFDSLLGKFNAITGNLGKFLKREKRLHLRFLRCRVIAELFIFRSIHPDGIPKNSFS